MKKFLVILFVMFAMCAYAEDFESGKHYTILDLPAKEDNIRLVYSVYCPVCKLFEEQVSPVIVANMPKGVEFEEIIFPDYGPYGVAATQVLAVAKRISDEKFDNIKAMYFNEIIDKRGENTNNISAEQFTELGLKAGGITTAEYEKILAEQETQDLLNYWLKSSYDVVRVSKGIPSLVVKGKYLVHMEAVPSAESLNALILHLLDK